eukprot:3474244-Amphidinium_carterae.1
MALLYQNPLFNLLLVSKRSAEYESYTEAVCFFPGLVSSLWGYGFGFRCSGRWSDDNVLELAPA